MLRQVLLVTAIVTVAVSPAAASGLYGGVNAGYGTGRADYHLTGSYSSSGPGYPESGSVDFSGHQSAHGFLGGAQLGYDYASDGWMVGGEADIDFGSIDTGHGVPDGIATYLNSIPPITTDTKLQYLTTLRVRAGYSPMPDFRIYATGGLAYGGIKTDATAVIPVSLSANYTAKANKSVWHVGWTLGGGAEFAISDGVSLRAEYLYADLGRATLAEGSAAGEGTTVKYRATADVTANIVRLGVNFSLD